MKVNIQTNTIILYLFIYSYINNGISIAILLMVLNNTTCSLINLNLPSHTGHFDKSIVLPFFAFATLGFYVLFFYTLNNMIILFYSYSELIINNFIFINSFKLFLKKINTARIKITFSRCFIVILLFFENMENLFYHGHKKRIVWKHGPYLAEF